LTDPIGRITSFAYDAAGRVTDQTRPDGRVIHFTYDANGNIIAVVHDAHDGLLRASINCLDH
jgi:YD repeat-containing protein